MLFFRFVRCFVPSVGVTVGRYWGFCQVPLALLLLIDYYSIKCPIQVWVKLPSDITVGALIFGLSASWRMAVQSVYWWFIQSRMLACYRDDGQIILFDAQMKIMSEWLLLLHNGLTNPLEALHRLSDRCRWGCLSHFTPKRLKRAPSSYAICRQDLGDASCPEGGRSAMSYWL